MVSQRAAAGLTTEAGREADPLPADYDALQQGTKVQTQLTGGQPFNYTFAPQTDYYLKAHLFGDIFARNNLTSASLYVHPIFATIFLKKLTSWLGMLMVIAVIIVSFLRLQRYNFSTTLPQKTLRKSPFTHFRLTIHAH